MRKCISCGKSFKRPVYVSRKKWRKDWKFCSLQCRSEYGHMTSKCLFCGKEFRHYKYLNRQYCSMLCKNRSRPNRGGIVVDKCQFCGKDFTHKRSVKRLYCSQHCNDLDSRGKNHWNWKGGISRENHRRETKEYQNWRLNVYCRDHFTCQDCGKHCNRVNIVAHHIKGWEKYPELRYVVGNGITYCRSCHKKEHQRLDNQVIF